MGYRRPSRFEEFVKNLADHADGKVGEAARLTGISQQMGSCYMVRLRELMGWQAK